MKRTFLRLLCAVGLLLTARLALAQDPQDGVVVNDASMYWLKDTSRTPIYMLPSGTPVRVLRREGGWYAVVYHDPKYGDQLGYMQIESVRLDDGSGGGVTSTASHVLQQRGFVEGQFLGFPQTTATDVIHAVGDGRLRQDVFLKPWRALQFAAGAELRANSHDEVEDDWRLTLDDRAVLRPRVTIRRLAATLNSRHATLDLGKQFIRWGRTDILSPADRFAPRDYLNLIDNEVLPVLGARASVRAAGETFEAAWVPRFTPSRLPLLNQRWTALPDAGPYVFRDGGADYPTRAQWGARWTHSGRFETGLSAFDGFNHLADIRTTVAPFGNTIDLTRVYPAVRSYAAETSVPTPWANVKAETAYFSSPTSTETEYVLYVVELERQMGEWLFDGGYAGEHVTTERGGLSFGAERGAAKSIIGRAAYTIDARRSLIVESAVRQNGDGFYAKGTFTEGMGQHLRLTVNAVGLAGKDDDFFGQYHRNSNVSFALRFSY